MSCIPKDTVFQATIRFQFDLESNVIVSLPGIGNFNIFFDVNTASVGQVIPANPILPNMASGYVATITFFDDIDYVITFTFTKPGSACELNDKTLTMVIGSGDTIFSPDNQPSPTIYISSPTIAGVCCPPAKKRNRGISAPPIVCCDPKQFPNEVCPPQLRTTNGAEYVSIGNGCYVIVKRRR